MKKSFLNILLITLVLVIAAESILWLRSRTQSTSTTYNTVVTTTVRPSQPTTINPQGTAKPPPPFTFNGVTRIESYGTVTEVVEPGKKYVLTLDSGAIKSVVIDDKTVLGKAVYTTEPDSTMMTYNQVALEDIKNIIPSQRVDVISIKDKVNADNSVTLEKFVLLN